MGKAKTAPQTEKEEGGVLRRSSRACVTATAASTKPTRAADAKKKPAVKRVVKPKKAKQAENGNPKTEEPKAEATEAK